MSVMYSYAIILFTLTIYKRIKIPIIKTNKKQCLKRSKSEIFLENDDIDLNISKKNLINPLFYALNTNIIIIITLFNILCVNMYESRKSINEYEHERVPKTRL